MIAYNQQDREEVAGAEVMVPGVQKLWRQSSWLTKVAIQSGSLSSHVSLTLS